MTDTGMNGYTGYTEGHKTNRAMNGTMSNGTTRISEKEDRKPNILKRISNKIICFFETGFEKFGNVVGNHPWKTILIATIVTGLFCIGAAVNFTETNDNDVIWVPSDADVMEYKNYVAAAYPSTTRFFFLIFEAANVMDAATINSINDAYKVIIGLQSGNQNFSSVCLKSGSNCLVSSVLELWSYDDATISALTSGSIQTSVNSETVSPMYGSPWEISSNLGGRTLTGSTVTGARAAIMTFFLSTSESESKAWEKVAIDRAKSGFTGISKTYYFATRSFSDEAGDAIRGDVSLLSGGYFLVIIYLFIVFGKLNCVEQRIGLSLAGIIVIGMSIGFSFGLSSAAGWEYGPLHSVLPFLLLGIGVDDMFVIVGSYQSLSHADLDNDLPHRIGKMLRHAGVSILVTSVTDILAFGIGATTSLPALKSFCVFACLGILGLFCLSGSFFLACFTLDMMRTEQGRNACICCYKHKEDYQPNKCSQRNIFSMILRKYYSALLLKLPVKIIVMVITLGLLGLNIWGFINLKQEYDEKWFFPTDSYAYTYYDQQEAYFPSSGASGAVYCKNINYYSKQTQFDTLYTQLSASPYISNGTVDSWFKSYTDWLGTGPAVATGKTTGNYPNSETDFIDLLYTYVTTVASGKRHYREIVFLNSTGTLDIGTTYVSFQHKEFSTAADEITAMDHTMNLVRGIFSTDCFPYSRYYLQWETNKVIKNELYRNLGLASACVFVVTLILIANLWTSLMVFSCVIMTLVDVAGCMHLWGLTIDTVSCIQLVLAIGLAVDYSAHIGHTFMTFVGDKNERVKATLVEMGNPVFSGGFSTFLAFILLAASKSYVFTTFFKVFFLVVIFGLFHGLVYLPVLLSWIGPSPYLSADRRYKEESSDDKPKSDVKDRDSIAMVSNGRLKTPPPDYNQGKLPYIPPPDYTPPLRQKSTHNGRITPVSS